MRHFSRIHLITVPYDSGRFDERLGRGPWHLVRSGLLESLEGAGLAVEAIEIRLAEPFVPEVEAAVKLQALVHGAVLAARDEDCFPILLAGNCNSAALGTVSALGNGTGVVWLDAHGDFNTPDTSPSGFLDGMALAVLVGDGWPAVRRRLAGFEPLPQNQVLFIGGRDLDDAEKRRLEASEIAWVREAAAARRPIAALALTAYGPKYDAANRGSTIAVEIALAALQGPA